MTASRRKAPAAPERALRVRQRQRLIDACISALHLYGPSSTTVEKVVTIADMSPGIVNFYFDTKAAMLVAALDHLAVEFEREVIEPVAALRDDPARALELLIDLYFDPVLASPRKVSVWYAFWGEANSRQEYHDICGKKDENFAALVQDLVARLIAMTGGRGLDADAVALGLIGALEILWQTIAFQEETQIDRAACKRRCRAYLRSIFPVRFAADEALTPSVDLTPAAFEAFRRERDGLFLGGWQWVGDARDIPATGDYLALEVSGERVLALRDHDGAVRAYRNACRLRPHALTRSRRGRFDGAIICTADGARYGLDGGAVMGARGLHPVEVAIRQGLLFVRLAGPREGLPPDVSQVFDFAFDRMAPLGPDIEIAAAADWRRVVEQALDGPAAEAGAADHVLLSLPPPLGWSAARYDAILASSDLAGDTVRRAWRRVVVFPGIIIDLRPDGVSIRQVTPLAPGRCRIALRRYGPAANGRAGRALAWLARRIEAEGLARDIAIAESTEAGLGAPLYAPGDDMGETDASRRLREWIAPRLARVAHS